MAFLSALKNAGLPGPHLVVTPLAVLQNWANELKRFTPDLSFVKIHGSASERDRLLSPFVLLCARRVGRDDRRAVAQSGIEIEPSRRLHAARVLGFPAVETRVQTEV